MQTFGIIAEFNPFHNGHYYLFQHAEKLGAEKIAVALSPNFVERGSTALISKYKRAETALLCGADLVLAIPTPFALSSAMHFADGGIAVLKDICDTLIFGSECGDTEKLTRVAKCLLDEKTNEIIKANLKSGKTFAKIREEAVAMLLPDDADVLENPNDILAVEYILASIRQNAKLKFVAVKRQGANHDEPVASNGYCSSSYIRENLCDAESFMPKKAYKILKEETENGYISDIKNIETAIIHKLSNTEKQELLLLPDISEGIEQRIITAAKTATSLEELLSIAKTKRYTAARIKRTVLLSFLGITSNDYSLALPYLHILGMKESGSEIIKNHNNLRFITSLKEAEKLNDDAKRAAKIEINATDIFNLSLSKRKPALEDYTNKFKIIKEN